MGSANRKVWGAPWKLSLGTGPESRTEASHTDTGGATWRVWLQPFGTFLQPGTLMRPDDESQVSAGTKQQRPLRGRGHIWGQAGSEGPGTGWGRRDRQWERTRCRMSTKGKAVRSVNRHDGKATALTYWKCLQKILYKRCLIFNETKNLEQDTKLPQLRIQWESDLFLSSTSINRANLILLFQRLILQDLVKVKGTTAWQEHLLKVGSFRITHWGFTVT